MIVREYSTNDLDEMVHIWLEASKQAHQFIAEDYWVSNQKAMKEVYFPMSQSFVLVEDDSLIGFISLVDNYLAALFVDPAKQGKGYGKVLLDYTKEQKESLKLKVYQENKSAIGFYIKNKFTIAEESVDENTSAKGYVMVWRKG
ncbi:N-acetyltransferase [Paenibacillus sp. GSMTC-2017]|uniref:N-acetyltransferase n=1 Tax=Paenibacillus sp. GSMTC-2017 TaxID=2794350 RepID=UPI0018D85629|nr:N-acetyltransferase [Paenibacillus sp. GSMTC-2017]MBH5316979.1 N-acetyltransferase [Paenibacillus sp. GSMTC-2017]